MKRAYERALSEYEKKILKKHIAERKSQIPKNIRSIILLTLLLIIFVVLVYFLSKTWLITLLAIASFFIIWNLFYEISDLVRLPKFLKKKIEVIENGIVRVYEIKIDRYIKIANQEDEGNYFIVEYNGMLNLIGGQEFLSVRNLKSKIEQNEIMDAQKTEIYYSALKRSGKKLCPYYTFEKRIPDTLIESKIWGNLTNRSAFFLENLEDLDKFIEMDKEK